MQGHLFKVVGELILFAMAVIVAMEAWNNFF